MSTVKIILKTVMLKVTTTSKDGVVSERSHVRSEVLVKVKNGVPAEKELASA